MRGHLCQGMGNYSGFTSVLWSVPSALYSTLYRCTLMYTWSSPVGVYQPSQYQNLRKHSVCVSMCSITTKTVFWIVWLSRCQQKVYYTLASLGGPPLSSQPTTGARKWHVKHLKFLQWDQWQFCKQWGWYILLVDNRWWLSPEGGSAWTQRQRGGIRWHYTVTPG